MSDSKGGGQGGSWPPGVFTHSLLNIQISKILPFLVFVNGPILIGTPPPPGKFSVDALDYR